jgi:hypothetical protein
MLRVRSYEIVGRVGSCQLGKEKQAQTCRGMHKVSRAGNSGRRTDHMRIEVKNRTVGSEGREYGIDSEVLKRIRLV